MPTKYPAARLVVGIVGAIGWILIAGGGFALITDIVMLNALTTHQQGVGGPLMMMGGPTSYLARYLVMGVSAIAILFGLSLVAAGQMARATTDPADYNREMLELMRKTVPVETPRLPSDLPTTVSLAKTTPRVALGH